MDHSPLELTSPALVAVPTEFMQGRRTDTPAVCVHQLFEQQVERSPDSIAVRLGFETLTYRELNDRANQLAHLLRARGVGPDVLVGVAMERSLDLLVSIYGILKAGGAYVPLDPTYPSDRLQHMVESADLRFLITHQRCVDLFTDHPGLDVVILDQSGDVLADHPTSNPPATSSGDNLIYVIFTSGSTGDPKAAAVYHRGFVNLVHWFVSEFEIASGDDALLISSLSFDLTQKNLFATLTVGGTLHLYPPGPYDLSLLSELIAGNQITLINCTPSAFYPLVEPFDAQVAEKVKSLRVVFLGGEPINTDRVRPWLEHSTCKGEIANTYGPTECTDICGFYRLTKDNIDSHDFVPLGGPVDNVQLAIINEKQQLCHIGEAGEICVGGAGIGAGYINDAEITSAKFIKSSFAQILSPRLYRTGDQGKWHRSGVIEFLGRLDHQVKIRGFRIELPEIERAVEKHPWVSEAIVVVKGRSNDDPQLTCCYTQTVGQSVTGSALRSHLSELIPEHMIPTHFERFDQFPLSPNGKVDRKSLQRTVDRATPDEFEPVDCTLPTGNQIPTPPANFSFEEKVLAAWVFLLDTKSIDPTDNFFDAGGDSLQLARLHLHLESLLGTKFPITDLFAHPTIQGMAEHLGNATTTSERPAKTITLSMPTTPSASAVDGSRSQVDPAVESVPRPSKPVGGTPTNVRARARLQREAMAARRRKRG